MTIHVWSGAAGSNDGTSWTDAYNAFQDALDDANALTDDIFIHVGSSPHFETFSSAVTFDSAQADSMTAPIVVYGVDKDNSNAPLKVGDAGHGGLQFDTTSNATIDFSFFGCIFGIDVHSDGDITLQGTTSGSRCISGSRFETEAGSDDVFIKSISTHYTISESTIISAGQVVMDNGSQVFGGVTFDIATSPNFVVSAGASQDAIFSNCDMSAQNGDVIFNLVNTARCQGIVVRDTLMPETWTAYTGTFFGYNHSLQFHNCDDSTDYARTEIYRKAGDVKTDTGVYLTSGGWSDETANSTGVPLSHKLTPSADCSPGGILAGLPQQAYVASTGEMTFTVELIDDFETALQDDEAWLDITYYDTSGQVRRITGSSRVLPGDAMSDLAAGAGTGSWTGEPASSRSVKLAVTVTVGNIGHYEATVRLAKYEANGADGNPGAALYVAPLVTVS